MTLLLLVAADFAAVLAAAGVGEGGGAWVVGGNEMAASLRVNRIITE